MDIMLLVGLAVMAAAFLLGVPDLRLDTMTYLQFESFILVFLGTIASTLISTSGKEFKGIFIIFKQLIFKPKRLSPERAVEELVRISEAAQHKNKQALVEDGVGIGDGFLERALVLVADGFDRDFVERTLDTDISEVESRHGQMITMMRTMGTYAPMFGMTGTVMGVVQVLKNVTDVDNIVSGMSLALLTTLYGLIFTGVIFVPVANKLKGLSQTEILTKEIIKQGVLAIMDKEIPLKVERYLRSYLDGRGKKIDHGGA